MFKRSFVMILAILLLALTACGGATPTKTAPSSAPTAVVSTTNTPAPVSTPAPVTTPASVPTVAPTDTPTRVPSATPSNGIPSAASVVPQAIAKTRAATVFKSSHVVNLSPAFGAQYDNMRMFYANNEFNGKEAHLTIGGLVVAPINPKTVDEIQVYRVGGQTYIHGPAAALGAPDNKWYVLTDDLPITGAVDTFNMLDQLAKITFDWSAFKYDGSNINGQLNCTVYTAGKDVVTKMPPLVWLSGSNPPTTVVEDGSISFWACNNGYLSQIDITLKGYDLANPDVKGTAQFNQMLSNFDTPVTIAAPAGAVPASKPATPFVLAMPTPYVSAPKTPTVTIYNGTWEGKSSTDSLINFLVENNKITNASLNYSVLNSASERPADCPLGDGGAHAGTVDATPVNGNTFTLKTQGGGQTQLTFTGTFKSNTTAEGTLHLKGVLSFCDKPYETDVTWTATKKSAASSSAASSASSTKSPATSSNASSSATSSATKTDADLVQTFFDAVNAKNIDAALAVVDDNVIYTFGTTTGIGKSNLKTYLNSQVSKGVTYQVSNVLSTPASVNFTAVASATTFKGMAMSSSGKIVILKLQ